MKQVRKKYRIPRKLKKQEKRDIVFRTNKDLATVGEKLTNKEVKSLKYSVWIMAGVVYHRYSEFTTNKK